MAHIARPSYDRAAGDALNSLPPLPLLSDETIGLFRSIPGGVAQIEQGLEEFGLVHREEVVRRSDGSEFILSIIKRDGGASGRPVLYNIHGGGMIFGDRFSGLAEFQMLRWTRDNDLVLVSVEYRLSPEHPAPAGVEDCYDGLTWVAEHAADIGGDRDRIIVGGVSGGGGLAAGTVLLARDRAEVRVLGQMLITPQLDDRNDSPSALQYRQGDGVTAMWPLENNQYAWNAVLGTGHELRGDISAYIAPGRAQHLAGSPSTFIDAGSSEVFRDPAVRYASLLWEHGVQTELHIWGGGFHGFELAAPSAEISQAAHAARANWLRRLLAT